MATAKAAARKAAKKRPKCSERAGYAAHKARMGAKSRASSAEARDIGPIPRIRNVERREGCRLDLRRFCETYNPEAFTLAWSADHLKVIARLEEAVLQGALYAFAMPRGSGKTTLCRMAALWAVSYGHCRYVFVVGANAAKAQDTLEAVKTFARFLGRYAQDFPEVAYPAERLGGIAHRAGGQLSGGQSTLIEWATERLVLPTVLPPANWPKHWPLRKDGKVPTAGSLIVVSGLTGDGIRGSVQSLTTGEQIRPDLVLLDDPQTDEAAASPSQNVTREALVSGAVLGMAGPGKTISAVMPCTVIRPGDFIDRVLDREKHPMWRGERTRMLRTMPTDLAAWDRYFEVYHAGAQREPPDFAAANAYYRQHRAELDAGAEASWPARKLPGEVSPIQHAMNLYARDKRAFFAEYQNDPLPDDDTNRVETMTVDEVAAKVNRLARQMVPLAATKLTAAIDVQHSLLYFAVCAWADDFTGAVIDYGSFPDQRRAYFALADAKATLAAEVKGGSLEADVYQGLERLTKLILGREWVREDGTPMRVARCLIDAGDGSVSNTVCTFCRQSGYPSVTLPYKGKAATAAYDHYGRHVKKMGESVGLNWIMPNPKGTALGRHVQADPNFWKSFVHQRLGVPLGGRGCLSLFGADASVHRMLADHVCAEKAVRMENKDTGRQIVQWMNVDRRDNHLFDALVYCAVGASVERVTLAETAGGKPPPPKGPRMSMSDRQRAKLATR